jgi:hypothetical protein
VIRYAGNVLSVYVKHDVRVQTWSNWAGQDMAH